MQPFKISLTAVRLLCFASWLSTVEHVDVYQRRVVNADG